MVRSSTIYVNFVSLLVAFFDEKVSYLSRVAFLWGSVAGSVIQVTGTVEFEDGLKNSSLETAGALVAAALIL